MWLSNWSEAPPVPGHFLPQVGYDGAGLDGAPPGSARANEMPVTKVTRAQFEIRDNEVVHRPTGACFTAYPGEREPYRVDWAMSGSLLQNGDDYRQADVSRVARQLLAER